jgi:CHAT domain-containing protein
MKAKIFRIASRIFRFVLLLSVGIVGTLWLVQLFVIGDNGTQLEFLNPWRQYQIRQEKAKLLAVEEQRAKLRAKQEEREAKQNQFVKERSQLSKTAQRLRQAGNFQEAVAITEQWLLLEREQYGSESQELMNCLRFFAECALHADNLGKARAARAEILHLETRAFKPSEVGTPSRILEESKITDARLALAYVDAVLKLTPADRRELLAASRLMNEAEALSSIHGHRENGYREAFVRVEQSAAIRKRLLGEQHPEFAQSIFCLARMHVLKRDYAQAEPLYRRSLEIRKKVFGEEHAVYKSSLSDYTSCVNFYVSQINENAATCMSRGDYTGAESLYLEALELRKKVQPRQHDHYAECLANLASSYYAQEEFTRAAPLYQEALEMRKTRLGKVLGLESADYAISLGDMAALFHRLGKYSEAEPLYREALEIKKTIPGEMHPTYTKGLDDLARLYKDLGDYGTAEPLYLKSLDIQKRFRREEHPQYAASLNNLAALYEVKADYERAGPLYRQALEIRKKVQGEQHPDYAQSLDNLAGFYKSQGDYARAEPLLHQALENRKKIFGEKHLSYAEALNSLAVLQMLQGNYSMAEPLYRQALAVKQQILGDLHPSFAQSLCNFAELYESQGDYARAEPLYLQAAEIRQKVLGEAHSAYAQSLNHLAGLYVSQGDFERARALYHKAIEINKDALGELHPQYGASLYRLAALYQLEGDYAHAEFLTSQAAEIQRKVLGDLNPEYAASLNSLASFYWSEGDYAQAEPLYRRAMEIRQKTLGELHPAYADSLSFLGLLLPYLEQADEGLKLASKSLDIVLQLLERTAVIQSERQQLAMARQVSKNRDSFVTVARLANASPEQIYGALLPLKGLVSARLFKLRGLQRQAAREPGSSAAQTFIRLVEQTRLLARLAQVVPPPAQAEAHQQRLRIVHTELEEIQQRLSELSIDYREAEAQQARTPTALSSALPESTALIDLVAYSQYLPPEGERKQPRWEPQLVAFIIRHDQSVKAVFLGPAEPIEKSIQTWRATFGTGEESSAAGVSLRKLLWEPLAEHLDGVHTVLVSPEGQLCGLPWGALPGSVAGSFLIEERAFGTIPIPQLLPAVLAGVTHDIPSELLLVGDIDYGGEPGVLVAGTTTRAALQRDGERVRFAALNGGREEVVAIQNAFGRRFSNGSEKIRTLRTTAATEAEFRRNAIQSRWLHVITHGYFAPALPAGEPRPLRDLDPLILKEQPMRLEELAPDLLSGLALTGANQPLLEGSDDGILTALEVSALDLHRTEMVVLSACETGLGASAGGEGLLGLQRAFQLAGAKTTVASLWKVHDQATLALMIEFYDNLWRKKLPKLEALRHAQISILRGKARLPGSTRGLDFEPSQLAGTEGRLPPYYWAAFVLSGDWRI